MISKKKLAWQLPFLLFLIVGTVIIIRNQRLTPYQKDSGSVFGTEYHITYQSDSSLQQSIMAELRRVDESLSMFNPKSTISRINKGETDQADELFAEVFQKAQSISKETNGAFDITVAPLVNAWGFGFKQGTEPTQHAIDSLLRITGYQKVSLKGSRVVKSNPQVMLDCSAIAKGYGSDRIAKLLRSRGVENYMIEIGGEIVTRGISPKRLPWKIGVTKPTDDTLNMSQELQTVLNVTDRAMATSGNYRNFYYKNGRKYAHTIDPKSGRPVQHDLLSATVLADDCATADAYATSFMVLGLDGAKKILANHPELMAYLIYTDKNGDLAVWKSEKLREEP